MKKLLVYLKDYKKESILGPLFKLLEASFELLVPLVVTKIIDVGIATGDVHYIVRMVLLMVGLAGQTFDFTHRRAKMEENKPNPFDPRETDGK